MATETKKSNDSAGIGCLIPLAIAGRIGYGMYAWLDSVGWMAHRQDSVITAESNWFVGESKNCTSYPLDQKTAREMSKSKEFAISKISCDGGPEHSVPVTFYGRTEQPEYTWIMWRCTRNGEFFHLQANRQLPSDHD
jgi:hypothetical protein